MGETKPASDEWSLAVLNFSTSDRANYMEWGGFRKKAVMRTTSTIAPTHVKAQGESSLSGTNTDDVSALAAATFDAFRPYINVTDCGKKLWDEKAGEFVPMHLTTQEAYRFAQTRWTLSEAERKAFKPAFESGVKRGKPFHYWVHYLSRQMKSEKVAEHIRGDETYYYTSAKTRRALAYLDIDAHDGQDDELKAKQLFQDICGSRSAWSPSPRGQNGYLKIFYGPV